MHRSRDTASDSTDRKGHGAHGVGRGEEKTDNDPATKPGGLKGSDRGGSAGWGNASSGGSVVNERPKH